MTLCGYSRLVNWFTKITKQIEKEEGDSKMKFSPIWQKFQDNPAILGIGIIVILLFGLLLHEYLLDSLTVIFEPGNWRYHDFRIAVIHCILAGSPLLAFTLPGCPSWSAPPALVVWGLAGAFRFFRRSLEVKWRWMLG